MNLRSALRTISSRKYVVVALLFLAALSFRAPTALAAGNGACSGHGGVDCSAGADYDGSVICFDGWTNSSVSFRSVEMCRGQAESVTCTLPEATGCKTELDYLRLKVQADAPGATASALSVSERLSLCRAEIRLFQARARLYNLCLEAKNPRLSSSASANATVGCMLSLGLHAKVGSSPGTCACDAGYAFNEAKDTCVYDLHDWPEHLLEASSRLGGGTFGGPVQPDAAGVCPEFSSIRDSSGACRCNDGFFGVLSTCVVSPVYCQLRHGLNGEWDAYRKQCACKEGFQLDPLTNRCESIAEACTARYGLQASMRGGACACVEGASIDPLTGKCESMLVLSRRNQPAPAVSVAPAPAVPPAPVSVSSPVVPATVPTKPASRYFVGVPKTKQDLLNCLVVGNAAKKLYHLRGSAMIKAMAPAGKACFATESAAKAKGLKKGK